jgi:hypothetical protein
VSWIFLLFGFYAKAFYQDVPVLEELASNLLRDGLAILASVFVVFATSIWKIPRGVRKPLIKEPSQNNRGVPKPLSSFPELLRWIGTDNPIQDGEYDLFGHIVVARRTAERLLRYPNFAQALIGRFGSGKTTILEMTIRELEAMDIEKRTHIVPIGLWPYETTKAAVIGTIGAIIDALNQETNTIGLRTLPGAYVQSMSAAGGMWAILAPLFQEDDPYKVLKAIDDVASAIGHHYVVWIEDLERFAGGGHPDAGEGETVEEAERLRPIKALLYGLNELSSVTIVTATTTLHTRFDLNKIARFVEKPLQVSEESVGPIIDEFKSGCLAGDWISPLQEMNPNKVFHFLELNSMSRRLHRNMFGSEYFGEEDALLALCVTPRSIKSSLEACWDVWGWLKGEIDFYDVLVMSFLRTTNPDFFAWIEKHYAVLQDRDQHSNGETRDLEDIIEAPLEKMEADEDIRRAFVEIVKFIFEKKNADMKPQGLAKTIYWDRYLAMPKIEETEKDQTILRVIKASNDGAFIKILKDDRQGEIMERFEPLISSDQLQRIFIPLVKSWMLEDGSTWHEGEPPGFIRIWRLWLKKHLVSDQVSKEVLSALDLVIPSHLGLAAEIEHYFVVADKQNYNLLNPEDRTRLVRYLRARLSEACKGKPDVLLQGLHGVSDPWVLSRLIWPLDDLREGRKGQKPEFEEWASMANTILDATRRNPQVMLPQLAGVVTDGSSSVGPDGTVHRYTFKIQIAQDLFGSAEVIHDQFRNADPGAWESEVEKSLIRAVKENGGDA